MTTANRAYRAATAAVGFRDGLLRASSLMKFVFSSSSFDPLGRLSLTADFFLFGVCLFRCEYHFQMAGKIHSDISTPKFQVFAQDSFCSSCRLLVEAFNVTLIIFHVLRTVHLPYFWSLCPATTEYRIEIIFVVR